MLTDLSNSILILLFMIIVRRESKKFSFTSSLWYIVLGTTAATLQIVSIIQSW